MILAFFGCQDSTRILEVEVVDRKDVTPLNNPNPLLLVVEIDDYGQLYLNKIETGRIDDVTELSEKLGAVFDDRKKTGIEETEVIIDANARVKSSDLEKLFKSLADLKASPIRVIKTQSGKNQF